jgi:hypothetical protein
MASRMVSLIISVTVAISLIIPSAGLAERHVKSGAANSKDFHVSVLKHIGLSAIFGAGGIAAIISSRAMATRNPVAAIQSGTGLAGGGLMLALAKAHVTVAVASEVIAATGDVEAAQALTESAMKALSAASVISGGIGTAALATGNITSVEDAQNLNRAEDAVSVAGNVEKHALAVLTAKPGQERSSALAALAADAAKAATLFVDTTSPAQDKLIEPSLSKPEEGSAPRTEDGEGSPAPTPDPNPPVTPVPSGGAGMGSVGSPAPSVDGVSSYMTLNGTIVITAQRDLGPGWRTITPGPGASFGGGAWSGMEDVRRLMRMQQY